MKKKLGNVPKITGVPKTVTPNATPRLSAPVKGGTVPGIGHVPVRRVSRPVKVRGLAG